MKENKRGIWLSTSLVFVYILVALFILYIVWQYGLTGGKDAFFVKTKQEFAQFPINTWLIFLYIHIILGSFALILGPFQFSQRIRRNKKVHRSIGRIYIVSIIVAAIVGMYLAGYATGIWFTKIGFVALDLAWLYTTLIAFIKIRNRQVTKHKEWMLRSYAVTFTFVSFRIWSILAVMVDGRLGYVYGLAIYFSWISNLIIVQFYMNRRKKQLKHNKTPQQLQGA